MSGPIAKVGGAEMDRSNELEWVGVWTSPSGLPWFRYILARTGEPVVEEWIPGTDSFRAGLEPYWLPQDEQIAGYESPCIRDVPLDEVNAADPDWVYLPAFPVTRLYWLYSGGFVESDEVLTDEEDSVVWDAILATLDRLEEAAPTASFDERAIQAARELTKVAAQLRGPQ